MCALTRVFSPALSRVLGLHPLFVCPCVTRVRLGAGRLGSVALVHRCAVWPRARCEAAIGAWSQPQPHDGTEALRLQPRGSCSCSASVPCDSRANAVYGPLHPPSPCHLRTPLAPCQGDEAGMTPLHACAFHDQATIAQLLLDSGADWNAPRVSWTREGGWVGLTTAVHGRWAVCSLPESYWRGCYGQADNGLTPLQFACSAGSAALVQVLLRHKVDPNQTTVGNPALSHQILEHANGGALPLAAPSPM
jgi:hypothetical protein